MKFHPYSDIWPMLKGQAFLDLVQNIRQRGQQVGIITYQGQILDGRNRYLACIRAQVEPVYEERVIGSDDEALDLVFSLNQVRRQLTKNEAIAAAERYATMTEGRPKKITISKEIVSAAHNSRSINEAAERFKQFGVTPMAVGRMRAVRKHAGEDGVQEVLSGKTSLAAKAKQVWADKKKKPAPRPKVTHVPLGPHKDFALSREQVDPEFVGSNGEFKDKYGHVVMHTAEERARMRFGDWASAVRGLAKEGKSCPLWSDCDEHWLRSPRPQDVAKLTEALEFLEPKLARARALLDVAVAALTAKASV